MPYVSRLGEASEEVFIVDEVLDIRGHGGSTEYLIRWEGYPDPEWTFARFCSCREAVRKYHNKKRAERRYQARRAAGRPTRRPSAPKVIVAEAPKLQVVGADLPQVEAKEGESTCVCCQTNKVTHIVQPCNHACLCSMCVTPVSTLSGCPKCRKPIERLAPFYLE